MYRWYDTLLPIETKPESVVETKPLIIEEIEFITEKDDNYFGHCSSLNNYQLPEKEQVFSNSGWSIDERGLFLNPPNSNNRLIFWDYQYSFESLKRVTWYFYSQGTNIYVNLFSQIINQSESAFRQSYLLNLGSFQDRGGNTNTNTFSKSTAPLRGNQYNIWELSFQDRMVRCFSSNSDYSVKALALEYEVCFGYKGLFLLGWHGLSTNKDHRLRKIVVESFI